jgi:hypothetical protein
MYLAGWPNQTFEFHCSMNAEGKARSVPLWTKHLGGRRGGSRTLEKEVMKEVRQDSI